MKTQNNILLGLLTGLILITGQCYAQKEQNIEPNTKYNVQREYDEDGNLIRYDSSSVSTWTYSNNGSELDSLNSAWNYYSYDSDTLSDTPGFNNRQYYSFDPFSDNFVTFPDINEIMNQINKNFFYDDAGSIDSARIFHPFNPQMQSPFPDIDISSHIKEMERMMDEMMGRHKEILQNFEKLNFEDPAPYLIVPDSAVTPLPPIKMTNTNSINI